MLLALDIGNTTIGMALFPEPLKSNNFFLEKIPTHPIRPPIFYKKKFIKFITNKIRRNNLPEDINVIISSVVPKANNHIDIAIRDISNKKPLKVSHKINCGIVFQVKKPEQIGADRIANAVAGINYLKKEFAVIDFGTATTITVIGNQRDFIGGLILPGIELMQRSLHSGTAKLPLISINKVPESTLGKDTQSSISSGIIYGTASAVEGIIKKLEKELSFRLRLIITGGFSNIISPLIKKRHLLIPFLTYEGLRWIYLRNLGNQNE